MRSLHGTEPSSWFSIIAAWALRTRSVTGETARKWAESGALSPWAALPRQVIPGVPAAAAQVRVGAPRQRLHGDGIAGGRGKSGFAVLRGHRLRLAVLEGARSTGSPSHSRAPLLLDHQEQERLRARCRAPGGAPLLAALLGGRLEPAARLLEALLQRGAVGAGPAGSRPRRSELELGRLEGKALRSRLGARRWLLTPASVTRRPRSGDAIETAM